MTGERTNKRTQTHIYLYRIYTESFIYLVIYDSGFISFQVTCTFQKPAPKRFGKLWLTAHVHLSLTRKSVAISSENACKTWSMKLKRNFSIKNFSYVLQPPSHQARSIALETTLKASMHPMVKFAKISPQP